MHAEEGKFPIWNLELVQQYLACCQQRAVPTEPMSIAWGTFYTNCSAVLRRAVAAEEVPEGHVEDCLQCLWLHLICKLPHLTRNQQHGDLEGWLYIVAKRRTVDYLRRQARSARTEKNARARSASTTECPVSRHTLLPMEQVIAAMDVLRHDDLSRGATDRTYQLLHLRWIQGKSVNEVALLLRLTPEQVHRYQHRAKVRLRRLLVMRNGAKSTSELAEL